MPVMSHVARGSLGGTRAHATVAGIGMVRGAGGVRLEMTRGGDSLPHVPDHERSQTRRWRTALFALLVVALAFRLGWALSRPVDETILRALPDQREYLELGRNVLAGRGLAFHDERLDVEVFAFRTPGYPLLIAACGGNIHVVRAVQALLDTSTVLAIYVLARRWLNERSSLLAAMLVALNPYLVYFTGLILSE